MIYFDNAATSRVKPRAVIDAVVHAMGHMGNAGRGVNSSTLEASRSVYETREKLAELFGAKDCKNIAFTLNSTEALNLVIKACIDKGDHVITTVLEHNSVLRPLYECEEKGASLSFVEADALGRPDYSAFARLIRPETKAIVCTHASNLTGNVVDIAGVGALCKERKLLFIVDASQTAGVFPIDVEKMHIDALCFTGHKSLLGPQGVGGLYLRPGLWVRGWKSGGTGIDTYSKTQPQDMPTRLEAGTLNGHGIAGLHAALSYIEEYGMDRIRQEEQALMRHFYEGLSSKKGIRFYGDFTNFERCPIVSFNIGDVDSAIIGDELHSRYDISVRTGGHCAPLMHNSFGTREQGMIRFSFSHFNSIDEVNKSLEAIEEILGDYT